MKLNAQVLEGFVQSVLYSKFDEAAETPEWHREAWKICTSKEKQVAIAAPRGHAKTTGVTVCYGLATLLFRERKFMLLVSDTETQAAMFLGYFKEHLSDNEALIDLFGIKRGPDGKVKFIKDTETDVIVEMEDGHKFRVIAKGAEQKLRGLIWSGSRPDIIMCDDMENDELVMNKDRREKMSRWFNSALMPCLSASGIVRIVGTILHMDSLLEKLMPKTYSKWTRQNELKTWSEIRTAGWYSVKYKAHNPDFSEILWPSRWTKKTLSEKRQNYIDMGLPDVYSQEYLNIPLDESVAYFKRNDFLSETDEDKGIQLRYYVTVDLAISEHEKADYSVFLVAGVDEHKVIHVKQVIRERLDGREIVDTLMALQRIYDPEVIGIEDMQVSKSLGPFLREEMVRSNCYMNIFPLKHGGKDKIARARSIQARMRAKTVKFDKSADWYSIFEEELSRFPRDRHDDQVDAFAYLGLLLDKVIEAPTEQEIEDEDYADELRSAEYGEHGRSAICGY